MTTPDSAPPARSSAPPAESATGPASLRGRIGTVALASTAALVVGQLLSVAQTVALARLLTPSDIGYFAAGSVFTGFVTQVVEGGLRAGLIQREDRLEDATETVFRATALTGLVMTLLAVAASPLIGLLFDSRRTGVVAASMAGGILLFSLTSVPEALLQRNFSVRRRLIVGPAIAFTFAVVSVTLAALGFGVWSLVIGSYASSTVWVMTVWWLCDWRPGRGHPDLQMYREMVRYGMPLAISNFVGQTVSGVQSVVTGRFLGVNSLGLYRYAERIAQLPVSGIVEVGANSLFPAYSRIASEPERFRRAYLHALGLLLVGAAAVSGLLIAAGEPLMVVVLGEKWRGGGVALQAMAGLALGTAMATSIEVIKGAGRTSLVNWLTAIDAGLGIGLVIWWGPMWGLVGVGLSVSVSSLVFGATAMGMARRVLDLTWGPVLRLVAPTVGSALVATLVVGLLEREVFTSGERPVLVGLLLLLSDGLLFLIVYGVALRLFGPTPFRMAQDLLVSVLTRLRRRST